ncbi:hypothetical protein CFP65_0121 [Kitasatospora sp. MMS16-BH015]|uniref:hypothetical protein n=1 Tax=Kitasatospora sp. MMS16-BH015 TaxID=2018025 RepID=UPI000CA0FCD5|nr:hypothetical protein [Kitasatospora sp. MMS16-BH015]AUG75105.1 hypothetical protein CFP65_0121 [Kitasatospora sp. MMS16-BH015]
MAVTERPEVRGSGAEAADLLGAAVYGGAVLLLDWWLCTFVWRGYRLAVDTGWGGGLPPEQLRAAVEDTALLLALVLFGLAAGAWAAGRRTTGARRGRYAAAGALAIQVVLPVVLASRL